jgi:hypothetical protein
MDLTIRSKTSIIDFFYGKIKDKLQHLAKARLDTH